ncbi:AAA family ATPase [Bacteroides zhangwenhongii]|jgi:predicted AAA+ superfamily ATPase|uniref:AAA family ATPase n=2 Tax=Bacteroides TaxID=816 RepID=A0ABT5H5I3_9BACE|nr:MULTISPECIES: AAA family ATPase [Bacteroides]MBC5603970.1 AAA family ATPase [Bacteroides difficilis]MDC7135851.1 AAA family ATPase [Bacteroides zhangwenhongii]
MIIDRNEYVEQLLTKCWNGKVKIVTGIRRSGKSFLLSTLFKNRLIFFEKYWRLLSQDCCAGR